MHTVAGNSTQLSSIVWPLPSFGGSRRATGATKAPGAMNVHPAHIHTHTPTHTHTHTHTRDSTCGHGCGLRKQNPKHLRPTTKTTNPPVIKTLAVMTICVRYRPYTYLVRFCFLYFRCTNETALVRWSVTHPTLTPHSPTRSLPAPTVDNATDLRLLPGPSPAT